ncbi:MAG: RdgB/HAM1 family non-canonical purine NTP pyrophosphatase [Bacteroidota bacterium]
MIDQIILATRNLHKIKELEAMLSGSGIAVKSLEDFPYLSEVEEDQPTLEGNALKKARVVFQSTGIPALADDSGLEVLYLNKQPGIYSSRFAGERCSYDDNNRKLLKVLKGVPPRRRQAQFRTVLALVGPGYERSVEGIVEGVIIEYSRGRNGFGYDPIFVPNGYTQTYAEMSTDMKNSLSHRSKALARMKEILLTLE